MEIRVNRIGRSGRSGGSGSDIGGSGGTNPPANTIVSIVNDNDVALVTTVNPHGLTNQTHIVIVGNSEPGYNGAQLVIDVPPSATTFHIGTYISNSTGGYWVRA